MRHSGAFAALFNECVLPNDPAAGHHWGIIDAFWLFTAGDPFAPGQIRLIARGRMISSICQFAPVRFDAVETKKPAYLK